MGRNKGVTLVELIVAIIILGVVTTISVNYYNTIVQQSYFKNAYNNILAMGTAEQNYYFNNGHYCDNVFAMCGADLNTINTNLNLNLIDNSGLINYTCIGISVGVGDNSHYYCGAGYASGSNGEWVGISNTTSAFNGWPSYNTIGNNLYLGCRKIQGGVWVDCSGDF